jgi:hypothetical protein
LFFCGKVTKMSRILSVKIFCGKSVLLLEKTKQRVALKLKFVQTLGMLSVSAHDTRPQQVTPPF